MSRLSRIMGYIENQPLLVIEIILALCLGVFAIYLGGPWYVGGPTTAIGTAIEAQTVRIFTAIIYFVPCMTFLLGRRNDKVKQWALFGMFLAYTFSAILRLLTFGITPLIWVFIMSLALICGILYISEASPKRKNAD